MIKKLLLGIWTLLSMALLIFSGPTIFAATGILISGLSTLLFWIFRKPVSGVVSKLRTSPKKKFVLIGSLGAVWVEFEFWALEKVFGVSLAANPDLFLDLLVTMPWYIIMVFLLWKVETKYSYSLFAILIYGGIYDFFADGILGLVLRTWEMSLGNLVLLLITFPVFVLSYSFIVFPPSYLLREEISKMRTEPRKGGLAKYLYGLLPLVGLLAYGIIAVLLFSMG
ncbi:MAG: hypothetical protein JSV39_04915 [Candidatus Aenigmatarchaeota archaeon]|nr:MAG: hypothetical protein JSV39_04915 [Candidatus Aenigmarchaeota archaeon]